MFSMQDIVIKAVRRCPFCDPRWRTKKFSVQMATLVFGFRNVWAFQQCIFLHFSMKYERKYIAILTITETSIFFNIFPTMHYIISKIVSTHMFSWSENVVLWICIYVYANEDRHYRKTSFRQYLKNYAWYYHETGIFTYVSMVKDYHTIT